MPEQKLGMFDSGQYDFRFDGVNGDPEKREIALKSLKQERS